MWGTLSEERTGLYFTVTFETSQLEGPSPRIYIPLGTRLPSYTPGHWVSILSPLTTRGGIVTRLHTGLCLLFSPSQHYIRNTLPKIAEF
jgi:hypothetical protein